MFATYPLYLPFYLGEFEMDGKRASAVVFGAPSLKVSSHAHHSHLTLQATSSTDEKLFTPYTGSRT